MYLIHEKKMHRPAQTTGTLLAVCQKPTMSLDLDYAIGQCLLALLIFALEWFVRIPW